MSTLSITEALAEIKTIDRRIEKKREFVKAHLFRLEALKDPHDKKGGSALVIRQERQAIKDLEEHKVSLRRRIQAANERTMLCIEGQERSIADWLVWRREVAPGRKDAIRNISATIKSVREQAMQKGVQVVAGAPQTPQDLIINIDEAAVAQESEALEIILGTLDGQLSLKNATTMIESE